MAKAKKLPSGNWRVQAQKTVHGKVVKKSFTSDNKKKAEFMALEWQQKECSYNLPEKITLKQAMEKYIEIHNNIFSPSSIDGYKKIQRNYFKDIQNLPISDLNEHIFQEEINKMALVYSPKTIKCAFSFACKSISYFGKVISTAQVKTPSQRKLEYNTPDIENLQKILEAVKGTEIELAVTLAILLGLRMSEILGLKWDAFSKDNNTVHIFRTRLSTQNGMILREDTKTYGSNRTIILPEKIKTLLKNADKSQEFIVPLTSNQLSKRFSRLLSKKNIPHCRFHDLRHANASIMLMLNIPDKYAMERGGWSTNDTLKKVYQQTFSSEQKKIADILDTFYTSTLFNKTTTTA